MYSFLPHREVGNGIPLPELVCLGSIIGGTLRSRNRSHHISELSLDTECGCCSGLSSATSGPVHCAMVWRLSASAVGLNLNVGAEPEEG